MVDVLSVTLVGLHINLVSLLSFNKDRHFRRSRQHSCNKQTLESHRIMESKTEILGVYP